MNPERQVSSNALPFLSELSFTLTPNVGSPAALFSVRFPYVSYLPLLPDVFHGLPAGSSSHHPVSGSVPDWFFQSFNIYNTTLGFLCSFHRCQVKRFRIFLQKFIGKIRNLPLCLCGFCGVRDP